MTIVTFILNKKSSLFNDQTLYYRLFLSLFLLSIFIMQVCLPIVGMDTDLWYHLTGGQFIATHKTLPTDSFFSFISPPREWHDYYWLFQLLVYGLYSLSGYYGLILLKSALFIATITLIARYMLHDQGRVSIVMTFTTIVVLLTFLLLPRFNVIRPHMFSYLFIICFILLLETRPRYIYLLPVLAVLWVNIHGVQYPVMVLLCVAYLIEYYLERMRNKSRLSREDTFYLVSIAVSLSMLFVTPVGSSLLSIPFTSTEYASQYIVELRHLDPSELVSLHIPFFDLKSTSLFSLVLAAGLLSLVMMLLKKQIRFSHIILFVAGLYLLTKAMRFLFEFSLLSLPLIRSGTHLLLQRSDQEKAPRLSPLVTLFMLGMLTLFSSVNIWRNVSMPPRYPFSYTYKKLPDGVAHFLNLVNTGGTVLNGPNTGGYLQFHLYPRYRIFMDMQVPFLFTDADLFIANNMFADKEVFGRVLARYNPSYVTVPYTSVTFEAIIRDFPEYTPVFFDDAEVLFVNRTLFPDIAARYAIRDNINPFALPAANIASLNDSERSIVLRELNRLYEMYKGSSLINSLICLIYNSAGQYEKALPFAEHVIAIAPESPRGYRLKGDTLAGMKDNKDALRFYQKALKRSDTADRKEVLKKMYYPHAQLKQYKEAYAVMKEAVEIFAPATTYKELYDYGIAALNLDKMNEAYLLLSFARLKVPPADAAWKKRIEDRIATFTFTTPDGRPFQDLKGFYPDL